MGVGRVTKNDIVQASIANTPIFAYRVDPVLPKDAQTARELKVNIIDSRHFQNMIDDIENIAKESLAAAKLKSIEDRKVRPPKPLSFFDTPVDENTNLSAIASGEIVDDEIDEIDEEGDEVEYYQEDVSEIDEEDEGDYISEVDSEEEYSDDDDEEEEEEISSSLNETPNRRN
jgi:hypothetical protein